MTRRALRDAEEEEKTEEEEEEAFAFENHPFIGGRRFSDASSVDPIRVRQPGRAKCDTFTEHELRWELRVTIKRVMISRVFVTWRSVRGLWKTTMFLLVVG